MTKFYGISYLTIAKALKKIGAKVSTTQVGLKKGLVRNLSKMPKAILVRIATHHGHYVQGATKGQLLTVVKTGIRARSKTTVRRKKRVVKRKPARFGDDTKLRRLRKIHQLKNKMHRLRGGDESFDGNYSLDYLASFPDKFPAVASVVAPPIVPPAQPMAPPVPFDWNRHSYAFGDDTPLRRLRRATTTKSKTTKRKTTKAVRVACKKCGHGINVPFSKLRIKKLKNGAYMLLGSHTCAKCHSKHKLARIISAKDAKAYRARGI